MTDRELLELAAKAVGVCLHPESAIKRSYGNWGCDTTCMICKEDPSDARWNPITNDGDALRLAVQLRLTVEVWDTTSFELAHSCCTRTDINTMRVQHDSDPCAATRRAIVRAAAEIGGNMK